MSDYVETCHYPQDELLAIQRTAEAARAAAPVASIVLRPWQDGGR